MKRSKTLKKTGSLFDRVKNYSDVCKELEEKEQAIPYNQIRQIQKLFNGDWKPEWSNKNEYKWFPYFEKLPIGWRSYGSYYYIIAYGVVAYYKDQQTSDFVGKLFKNIYINFIEDVTVEVCEE